MKLPEPRLHLVLDRSDTPEHTKLTQALDSSPERRIVCEIRPDGRGTTIWLARAVLQALGKNGEVAGNGRDAQLAWRRAIAWTASYQIEHLYVTRAQLLTPSDLQALLDLASLSGYELWLIVQGDKLPRPTRETIAGLPLRQWTFAQFKRRWNATPQGTRGPTKAARPTRKVRYDRLPDDEFPTFLHACVELLPKRELRNVEHDLCQAFAETQRWLSAREEVDASAANEFIVPLLESKWARPEMLVALRGAQAAFFEGRYLLKADLDRILARRATYLGVDRSAELAAAAAMYASTSHAAAATLCLLLNDPGFETVARLNLQALRCDGSTVSIDDVTVPVPELQRPPLHAHRLLRLLDGASENEPLFITEQRGEPGERRPHVRMKARGLQRLAREVTRETGLPLIVRYSASKRSSEGVWQFDLGLSVQRLRRREQRRRHLK